MKDQVNTKFFVNKEKGIVVCVIDMNLGMIADRFKKYDILIPDSYVLYDYHVTFKGIAKCAPEDTFDENYGKRLAEYRANVKRQRAVNKAFRKYIDMLYKNIDRMTTYGMLKDVTPPKEIGE